MSIKECFERFHFVDDWTCFWYFFIALAFAILVLNYTRNRLCNLWCAEEEGEEEEKA